MNAYPWNYPSTDTRETFCWTATAGCTNVVGDATAVYGMGLASKVPWDVQLDVTGANLGTTQTEGNNVDDARVWSGNHGVYGNAALVRDSSATRDYQPAWTNAWYTSGCNPDNVNATINPLGNDIEASTVSMFVGHNRHARLLVLPRLRRGPLERAAVQQRRHDGRPDAAAGRPRPRTARQRRPARQRTVRRRDR